MKLLAVERIKLLSTRSPYWCLAAVIVAALGFALMMGLVSENGRQFASTGTSQAGMSLGMMIFMVLAALSVTTEYRFGTIRTTFLAAPRRVAVFGAKTVVVMVLAAATALVCSFGAFFLTKVLASNPTEPLVLTTASDWRFVLAYAAVFPLAAALAMAVGALIRQSAGAIALLLVWGMLLEQLIGLIPRFGTDVGPWLPFTAASAFTTDRSAFDAMGPDGGAGLSDTVASGPTPLEGIAVFGATALALWLVAAFVLSRRDA